ncbi:MAG: toprim domain-containing protein, partial [bacterium]|nr:toprim domain-containing protein [bacterium]
ETPLFIKSNALYGIDKAKNAIRQKGYSVLVEGQMDLIMSHQAGFKNVIAGSGTALGSGNSFEVIRRLSNNIIFVYDADPAGEKAAERSADIALGLGMDVKIACLPDGLDPADAILKDVEIWRDALKNAKHVVEFVLDGVIKSSPDERRTARSVVEKVLPFVARLDKSSEQSHFLKIIKEKTGISESALGDDLRSVIRKGRADAFAKKTGIESPPIRNSASGLGSAHGSAGSSSASASAISAPTRNDSILRKAVGLYFWQKSSKKDLENPPEKYFDFENFAKKLSEILEKNLEDIIKEVKTDESALAFEAEAFYANSRSVEEEASNLLLILEEDVLKQNLTKMMKEISEAERTKDEANIGDLSKKWQITAKKITEIGKKLNR